MPVLIPFDLYAPVMISVPISSTDFLVVLDAQKLCIIILGETEFFNQNKQWSKVEYVFYWEYLESVPEGAKLMNCGILWKEKPEYVTITIHLTFMSKWVTPLSSLISKCYYNQYFQLFFEW